MTKKEKNLEYKGEQKSYPSSYRIDNSSSYVPDVSTSYYEMEIRPGSTDTLGLYTKENITAGSIVAKDGGTVIQYEFISAEERYGVFVDEGLILLPNDYENLEPLCYLNHSCEPNLSRIGGIIYIANQDIDAESELTVDYAPLVTGAKNWSLNCHCISAKCRKILTSEDWKNPEIAGRLWQEWLPYIQKKILKLKDE